jgi:hypothetical protein
LGLVKRMLKADNDDDAEIPSGMLKKTLHNVKQKSD